MSFRRNNLHCVMEAWKVSWQPVVDRPNSGGQGVVIKVAHRINGTLGALKQLHPEHLGSTERRFRMQQEANALLALDGHGVPRVLETNANEWNDKSQSLYIVMEWIEGPSLSQHVGGRALPLDDALTISRSLLDTVSRCHALDIYHRDLKPDNVILRNAAIDSAVLVDFGMSWTDQDDDATREYRTQAGQEIGNRFLRLPEHVPGRHLHDRRSDITMVVGLLFYMLTGEAPRALRDVRGAMPHEVNAQCFAPQTTQDPRWSRLRRVFNVGFQENIDLRFPSSEDLLKRLDDLYPSQRLDPDAELREELNRINDLLNSERARQLISMRSVLSEASGKYLAFHHRQLAGTGFVSGGSGPNLADGGRAAILNFFIVQQGASEPMVSFSHRLEVLENEFVATMSIEHGPANAYYRGPVSDVEALFEAVERQVPTVLAVLFRAMHSKLQSHY